MAIYFDEEENTQEQDSFYPVTVEEDTTWKGFGKGLLAVLAVAAAVFTAEYVEGMLHEEQDTLDVH